MLKERELAELQRESEKRYRFLAEAQPDQIWTGLPNGELDYVNQRAIDYFDLPFTELVESGWINGVHPEDLGRTLARWRQALDTGRTYENEFRLRRADGAYRWHLARAMPMRDNRQGEIVEVVRLEHRHPRPEAGREEAQRFLVEAGATLGSSLDYRGDAWQRWRRWLCLSSPTGCASTSSKTGSCGRSRWSTSTSTRSRLALELGRRYPEDTEAMQGPPHVLRTGKSELMTEIPDERLVTLAVDDLHLGHRARARCAELHVRAADHARARARRDLLCRRRVGEDGTARTISRWREDLARRAGYRDRERAALP